MNTSFSIAIRYGLYITASLIAYFLILRFFNLHENHWLRLFNGVFMAAGIYYSIKQFKKISGNQFTYVDGFKTGLVSGFIATIIFTGFIAIYLFHLDTEFAKLLLSEWFSNLEEGTGILVFIVLIEGLASTVVLTLTCMQIFKKSHNLSQKQ